MGRFKAKGRKSLDKKSDILLSSRYINRLAKNGTGKTDIKRAEVKMNDTEIEKAIISLEKKAETDHEKSLCNYLRANASCIEEAFEDE